MTDATLPAGRAHRLLFWSLLALIFVACAGYAARGELRGDEYVHFEQVRRFVHGDFRLMRDALTMLPGYHLLLAAGLHLLGADGLGTARVLSGLTWLVAVVGFHALRRDAMGRDDFVATAQFVALPILLPFAFLVYTDALSLGLVLWAAWAAGRHRHGWAAAFLLGAMLVRQNNVLWLVLLAWPLLWPLPARAEVLGRCRALLPYGVVGGAFLTYWIVNGSVSLSPTQAVMHPDFSPHAGNGFYLGILAALLLPAQCIQGIARFLAAARARPWWLLLPVLLALVYLQAFRVDHPYNLGEPVALRNWLLHRTQQSLSWHLAFGAVAVFGALGLLWQRLMLRPAWVLWPLAALFVSLSWLIEQRYALIPLALLLVWRQPAGRRIELATLALWAALAVLFFWGMISGRLYL